MKKRKIKNVALLPKDPVESAAAAGLRYVTADGPGITRRRSGKGFVYLGVDRKPIRDPAVIQRINSLVIPPAWTVLATVVRLLEATSIRVGNEEYAKENHSFGLTTLRNRHVQIGRRTLRFKFRGKSGQDHYIELKDDRLARIVRKLQDLPGYDLFEYLDDEGQPARISSGDVNDYLREITGKEFTAKDSRTWMGTGLAALALEQIGPGKTKTTVKRNVVAAIKSTSVRLGNRPPACRKYYIHPAILHAYADGTLLAALEHAKSTDVPHSLRREELAVMALVKVYDEELAKAPGNRAA
jgi:DNA topoisomerase-1